MNITFFNLLMFIKILESINRKWIVKWNHISIITLLWQNLYSVFCNENCLNDSMKRVRVHPSNSNTPNVHLCLCCKHVWMSFVCEAQDCNVVFCISLHSVVKCCMLCGRASGQSLISYISAPFLTSGPAWGEDLSNRKRGFIAHTFHYHPPIVLIWLKLCLKRRKTTSHPSSHFFSAYKCRMLLVLLRNLTTDQTYLYFFTLFGGPYKIVWTQALTLCSNFFLGTRKILIR